MGASLLGHIGVRFSIFYELHTCCKTLSSAKGYIINSNVTCDRLTNFTCDFDLQINRSLVS